MNEKAKVAAAMVLQLLAIVNLGLSAAGRNPLPFTSETIEFIISSGLATGISLWNLWKNRNVTVPAQKGQEITDALKLGKLLVSAVDKFLKEGED